MCGILGLFTNSNKEYNFINSLKKLKHRGPDAEQSIQIDLDFGKILFGHVRLSIIDLSKAGNQPMFSVDKKLIIIFNGEIYNYKEIKSELIKIGSIFYTNTDTEVLLESWRIWGKNCLQKLNGMFAFAIYDFDQNKIYCCRDAFGIKPLYYTNNNEYIYFGSEIPSIISLDEKLNTLDYKQAVTYLKYGKYDSTENTFYSDIKSVLPGHYIEFDIKDKIQISIHQWWLPKINENKSISYKDAIEKTRELFLENVRLNLRSDVSIGAALSGGLDSAAIVCAMRYLEPKIDINTFSFIDKDYIYNEEQWVDKVNNFIKSKPHKIVINTSDLTRDLDDLIKSQGEPFMSTSIYAQYCIYKKVKQENIVVTLDGQGADELLAGYNGYPEFYLKSLLYNKKYFKAIEFLQNWSKWPGRTLSEGMLRLISLYLPKKLFQYAISVKNSQLNNWLSDDKSINQNNYKDFKGKDGRFLMNKLLNEQTNGGLQPLLRHGDRNSMRWSIESRVPFLSTNFSAYLLTLPENFLLSNEGRTKNIFRDSLKGIVPEEILSRKDKIGFKTPEFEWLRKMKPQIMDWLKFSNEIHFINTKLCLSDIEMILEGKSTYNTNVWRFINFTKWVENNNIKIT
jgi:asparagine synthase (glutamine-hydrolysing)